MRFIQGYVPEGINRTDMIYNRKKMCYNTRITSKEDFL